MWVDIQDLITCATFGDNQLRELGVVRGEIVGFSTDLRRRLYLVYKRQKLKVYNDM